MRRFIALLVFLMLVLSLLVGFDSISLAQKKYNEAPMLADLVKQGKLPSVEKRLPEDPLVIEPVEEIGRYGGELRSAALGPAAFSDIEHAREFYFFRPNPQGNKILPNIARKWMEGQFLYI